MENAGSQRTAIRPSIFAVRRFHDDSSRGLPYSQQHEMEISDRGRSHRLLHRLSDNPHSWLTVSKENPRSRKIGSVNSTASIVARISGFSCNARPS
jgi:hypothetical protein